MMLILLHVVELRDIDAACGVNNPLDLRYCAQKATVQLTVDIHVDGVKHVPEMVVCSERFR